MLKIISVHLGLSEGSAVDAFKASNAYNPFDPASVISFLEREDQKEYLANDRVKVSVTVTWEDNAKLPFTYILGENASVSKALDAKRLLKNVMERFSGHTGKFADMMREGAQDAVAFMENRMIEV